MNFHCPECGAKKVRNETHDAYYCPDCATWMEEVCSDPDCEYCKDRPDTPPA